MMSDGLCNLCLAVKSSEIMHSSSQNPPWMMSARLQVHLEIISCLHTLRYLHLDHVIIVPHVCDITRVDQSCGRCRLAGAASRLQLSSWLCWFRATIAAT